MKTLISLLFLTNFVVFLLKSEEINRDSSSREEVLQLMESSENLVAPKIKGLSLIGNLPSIEGKRRTFFNQVEFVDLNVPGDESELAKRLSVLFLDQPLTQDVIDQIKRDIVLYYREHEHPVVMVRVPEQEVTKGVLQIAVTEGVVGGIIVSGNRYTQSSQLTRWISLKPGDSINEKRLLQDLAWINSSPFRNVSVTYAPGEAYGSTEIWLNVEDRRPIRVYVGGDNTGSQFTGRTRWFTGVNFANFFYPENLLSYQFTMANSAHLFQSHTGQFILPLPWRHIFNAFGAYATVHPKLSGFTSTGKSYQVSGRYDAPLWFTYPSVEQTLTLGFDYKGTNNNLIFGSDVEITEGSLVNIAQFVFGYHFGLQPRNQNIRGGIDIFWSPGQMISHQSNAEFATLNPNATAQYVYGRLAYSHEGKIYYNFSLFGDFQLQLSNSGLIPSEQLAIGGYNTVRGYPERVANGDNGLYMNFEARSPHFSPFKKYMKDDLYFLAFADFGFAWDHSKIPGLPMTQTLIGVGPGLRYRIGSYFNMRADLGFPLHHVENWTGSPFIHLSAILSY